MKFGVFVLFIILTVFASCSDNPINSNPDSFGNVMGIILDNSNNNPIQDIQIRSSNNRVTYTDTTGFYFVDSISTGQVSLFFSHKFYLCDSISFMLEENDTITISTLLTPYQILSYQISANIIEIGGTPGITFIVGEKIDGLISYQSDSENELIPNIYEGSYPQIDKSCRAEFAFSEFTFRNSTNRDTLFYVKVRNNIHFIPFGPIDELYFGPFIDTNLQDSLGLSLLKLQIDFQDENSVALCSIDLPKHIDIDKYNQKILLLSGKSGEDSWYISAEIEKMEYLIPNKQF